jgi:hypothetical protein
VLIYDSFLSEVCRTTTLPRVSVLANILTGVVFSDPEIRHQPAQVLDQLAAPNPEKERPGGFPLFDARLRLRAESRGAFAAFLHLADSFRTTRTCAQST